METDHTPMYATYPVFRALSMNPRTRDVVRPLLARYAGHSGLRRFDELYGGLRETGRTSQQAEQIALGIVTGQRDDKVLVGFGAPLTGWWTDTKKFLKDPGRVATAVATGGASEGLRAASKSTYDKLGDAIKKGWDSFEDQVKDTLKSLKKINSIRDVLSIVKMAVSGGISLMADAGFSALNDMIYDLLAPYLRRMGQVIGSSYVKGKAAVKKGVKHAFRKANKVVRDIMVYIVDTLYDLALGYPPCVLEEGCIGPVSNGLSNSGVPYVKAIGEALKVIYPIVQGTIYNSPETSQALYAYAGTKGSNGAMMLPQAKLPGKFAKTLVKVLEAFDEEYSMGVPKSYERYKPWLVDLIARGHRGPMVMAAWGIPKNYFHNPKAAQAVLKKGNKLGNLLKFADKYLGYIERAWAIGKKAYDIYEAVDLEDFSFDPNEWESGSLKEYINQKATEVQDWAAQWGSYAAEYAEDYAKSQATQFVEGQKKRFQTELLKAKQAADDVLSVASSIKEGTARDKIPDLRRVLDTSKTLKLNLAFKPGPLGADIATATMTEWQPAELGLMARAKWNEMALRWLRATPGERQDWKNKKKAVKRWKNEATDYPAWYKEFDTPKMKRLEIASKAYDLGFSAAAGSYMGSIWRNVQSSGILKDVVNKQGEAAGVRDMGDKVMATSAAVQVALKQVGSAVRLYQNMRNVQLPLKEQAKVITPEPVLQAERAAGLDKENSMIGPWVALGAAGAAVAVAAAVTRR